MPSRAALPGGLRACLFDLDGVLTQTATVHAAAWQEMFDAFHADRARRARSSIDGSSIDGSWSDRSWSDRPSSQEVTTR